ncbi:hypothetical protein [Okeania sp. SIO2C2]|nr:hypothetical protein [Okeania sp. SIO2C2]
MGLTSRFFVGVGFSNNHQTFDTISQSKEATAVGVVSFIAMTSSR